MKEYLKMADIFGDIAVKVRDSNGRHVMCEDILAANCFCADSAKYIVHAINSHDELVTMNKELLEALEAVIEWYDMKADHSIEPDFYKRMASCQVSEDMAREAIAKAKGV